jgi:hypothetical protein
VASGYGTNTEEGDAFSGGKEGSELEADVVIVLRHEGSEIYWTPLRMVGCALLEVDTSSSIRSTTNSEQNPGTADVVWTAD